MQGFDISSSCSLGIRPKIVGLGEASKPEPITTRYSYIFDSIAATCRRCGAQLQ
jgi:hypothetical protein